MFGNIAAIDIGSTSIKIVTAKSGFRDFQIKSFYYETVDPDIENTQDAVLEAFGRILSEVNFDGYKVITNLPMEKTIIRNISFPFSDVEKIAEAIPYEAEEHIPYKLDDLVLDFRPLKSFKESEGRILLAAAHKDSIVEYLKIFEEKNIKPEMMGLESTSLFECYQYFNTVTDESVIQLDIGSNKTIMNIISGPNLLFTRSISIGVNHIIKSIADILKINMSKAANLYSSMYLDLRSLDNNLKKDFYKQNKISRSAAVKIYNSAIEIIDGLIEQVLLTRKAFIVECGDLSFNRIIISGGGSNITGLSSKLSTDFEIPVIPLPFLNEYKEQHIRSQFPIVFGLMVSAMKSRKASINFLKGEFLPDVSGASNKIYYLAAGFGLLSAAVMIVYIVLSLILTTGSNKKYRETMENQFKKYFLAKPTTDNPLSEARKIVNKEKKELEAIDAVISGNESILEILNWVISYFPGDEIFDLKNIVINERIIRLDASIGNSKKIDDFKEKLIQSKKFESVTVDVKGSRRNEVIFSMTIKLKQTPGRSAGDSKTDI